VEVRADRVSVTVELLGRTAAQRACGSCCDNHEGQWLSPLPLMVSGVGGISPVCGSPPGSFSAAKAGKIDWLDICFASPEPAAPSTQVRPSARFTRAATGTSRKRVDAPLTSPPAAVGSLRTMREIPVSSATRASLRLGHRTMFPPGKSPCSFWDTRNR
jgi:hypothetical protein